MAPCCIFVPNFKIIEIIQIISLKRWTVSEQAKATTQTHFLPLFFPNNDLCVDPASSRTDQAKSGPVGPLSVSVCLPECCCPFRLQLHFHLKQLIAVAVPRGPVEETFKAVPFCSFYGPRTMAPWAGLPRQLELDATAL